MIKKCNKCNEEFDLTMFDKDVSKKDGYSTICKACRKQYREDNKEYRANQRHIRVSENKEMFNERKRICRAKNSDNYNENHRRWISENPERVIEYRRRDYDNNSDGYKRRAKLRRTITKEILSDLTNEQYAETLSYFNNECAYCGSKEFLQEEHIIPVARGGEYTKDNIIPACVRCNSSKWSHHIDVWYPKQTFFNQDKLDKITNFTKECANQSGRLNIIV